jgi:hypothetical protein
MRIYYASNCRATHNFFELAVEEFPSPGGTCFYKDFLKCSLFLFLFGGRRETVSVLLSPLMALLYAGPDESLVNIELW